MIVTIDSKAGKNSKEIALSFRLDVGKSFPDGTFLRVDVKSALITGQHFSYDGKGEFGKAQEITVRELTRYNYFNYNSLCGIETFFE